MSREQTDRERAEFVVAETERRSGGKLSPEDREHVIGVVLVLIAQSRAALEATFGPSTDS